MARTRSCKKTGSLKKPTKSGRKCRKVSKCTKGRLRTRQGRRQCKKKSTRRRPKTRGRPKTRRKHKRKYRISGMVTKYGKPYPAEFVKYFPTPYDNTKGGSACANLFDYLVKLNMYDAEVTQLIKEGKLPKDAKMAYQEDANKVRSEWKRVHSYWSKNAKCDDRLPAMEFALTRAQYVIKHQEQIMKKEHSKKVHKAEDNAKKAYYNTMIKK